MINILEVLSRTPAQLADVVVPAASAIVTGACKVGQRCRMDKLCGALTDGVLAQIRTEAPQNPIVILSRLARCKNSTAEHAVEREDVRDPHNGYFCH